MYTLFHYILDIVTKPIEALYTSFWWDLSSEWLCTHTQSRRFQPVHSITLLLYLDTRETIQYECVMRDNMDTCIVCHFTDRICVHVKSGTFTDRTPLLGTDIFMSSKIWWTSHSVHRWMKIFDIFPMKNTIVKFINNLGNTCLTVPRSGFFKSRFGTFYKA